MGEYCNRVNVDKIEYITPCDFGFGSKRTESSFRGSESSRSLESDSSVDGIWQGHGYWAWLGDIADIMDGMPEEYQLLGKHKD